jgi:hypothetical protein
VALKSSHHLWTTFFGKHKTLVMSYITESENLAKLSWLPLSAAAAAAASATIGIAAAAAERDPLDDFVADPRARSFSHKRGWEPGVNRWSETGGGKLASFSHKPPSPQVFIE